jgi:hypothetical protein
VDLLLRLGTLRLAAPAHSAATQAAAAALLPEGMGALRLPVWLLPQECCTDHTGSWDSPGSCWESKLTVSFSCNGTFKRVTQLCQQQRVSHVAVRFLLAENCAAACSQWLLLQATPRL